MTDKFEWGYVWGVVVFAIFLFVAGLVFGINIGVAMQLEAGYVCELTTPKLPGGCK